MIRLCSQASALSQRRSATGGGPQRRSLIFRRPAGCLGTLMAGLSSAVLRPPSASFSGRGVLQLEPAPLKV